MESTRSRGKRYALSALRDKRAVLAAEIVQLKTGNGNGVRWQLSL